MSTLFKVLAEQSRVAPAPLECLDIASVCRSGCGRKISSSIPTLGAAVGLKTFGTSGKEQTKLKS